MTAPLRLPSIEDYPERPQTEESGLDRWGARTWAGLAARGAAWRGWRTRAILRAVAPHASRFAKMDDAELRDAAFAFVPRLRARWTGRVPPRALAGETLALLREAGQRRLGLRAHNVQLRGAWALLQGRVAEMRTGEGKTLVAGLAASFMALAGRQVHVLTVNDYLAERDTESLRPLYDWLGLTVSTVIQGQGEAVRRAAYQADIVHATNKELAFDYLRDRAGMRRAPGNLRRKAGRLAPIGGSMEIAPRMTGLPVALVDEVDSVLIDEARTPLVISGMGELRGALDPETLSMALDLAAGMREGVHFRQPAGARRVEILDPGFDWLEEQTEDVEGPLAVAAIRDHTVHQALSALHVFQLGDAYIVKDQKVQIVDENTGRTMPDRQWSDGLHQLVELKEGLEPSPANETLSRITYQRFFRRYRMLCGMTGTAQDAAWELGAVYGLTVARIPTHEPDRRRAAPDRAFGRRADKVAAVAERAGALRAAGAAVLIGTRTIRAAEEVSAALTARSLAHQVLSAAQDKEEAAVIEKAGQPGAITVATNMAGRGTDIRLGPGVAEAGGLHVLLTERHDSRRVDRQLEGRCGRQGDPGRIERFLSLEDDLLSGPGTGRIRALATTLAALAGPRAAAPLLRLQQILVERIHARARRDLMEQDRAQGDSLALSGEPE